MRSDEYASLITGGTSATTTLTRNGFKTTSPVSSSASLELTIDDLNMVTVDMVVLVPGADQLVN